MAYDFTGLTNAQQWILTCQGWPCGDLLPKPRRSTYQPLVDRGLVIFHAKRKGGSDLGRLEVPLPVHMAWCMSCPATQEA
jgi:hypothetical protein